MFTLSLVKIMNKKDTDNKLNTVRVKLVKEAPLLAEFPIDSPEAAVRLVAETLDGYDREVLAVVNLNSHLKPLNMNVVSIGQAEHAIVDPANILKSSILSNATKAILIHNHPSGDLTPSKADKQLTQRMEVLYGMLGKDLIDHCIVGDGNNYFSFAANDLMTPKDSVKEIVKANNSILSTFENSTTYKSEKTNQKELKPAVSVEELSEKLKTDVKNLFDSEKFKSYLDCMAKFHNYSYRNVALIMDQKPDASYVAGFNSWHKNFERTVKKGEKGIRIFAPCIKKIDVEKEIEELKEKISKAKNSSLSVPEKKINIAEIEAQLKFLLSRKEKTIEDISYKAVTVFDISQTTGKPIPELATRLDGTIENFEDLKTALISSCPCKVEFSKINSEANGFYSRSENKIVVDNELSEKQTIKTLVHEIAHQRLHSEHDDKKRSTKEVEAESVAYVVCKKLGIDTSDYSFGYIAGWANDKELRDMEASLASIQKAAKEIINDVQNKLPEKVSEVERVEKVVTALSANDNEKFLLSMIKKEGTSFFLASSEQSKDGKFLQKAIKANPKVKSFLSKVQKIILAKAKEMER